MENPINHILFMDGDCILCQKSTRLLHQLDRRGRLHFSQLQGKAAQALPHDWITTEDQQGNPTGNVALIENFQQANKKQWRGADAILRALYLTGGLWKAAWLLHHIPAFIKNPTYQLIAKNRHKFSGGKKICELPNKDFSQRFVD